MAPRSSGPNGRLPMNTESVVALILALVAMTAYGLYALGFFAAELPDLLHL